MPKLDFFDLTRPAGCAILSSQSSSLTTAIRSSSCRSGIQRVGGRWKPDISAGSEWAWELPAERPKGPVVRAGDATVIRAEGIARCVLEGRTCNE